MPRIARWALLVTLSAAFAAALEYIGLPAAYMLGPMAAGLILALGPGPVHVARLPFDWAQAIIGCLIAQSITSSLVVQIGQNWPVFVGGVFSVVAISLVIGWLLTRWQELPGATAIWGASPGAAPAMIIIAGDYGCDIGLVAFMQYIRVVIVSVLAAVVAAIFMPSSGGGGASIGSGFLPVDWVGLVATVVFIVVATGIARRLRVPAGPLLVTMFVGALLQDTGLMAIVLPTPLLVAGYAVIGWGIGLRFTRKTVRQAMHALPLVLASTLCLVAGCGVLAGVLVLFAGLDPMTAYLATSPGGASSVAIISGETQVDVAYVMSMQIARAVFVIAAGPIMARTVSRWAGYAGD